MADRSQQLYDHIPIALVIADATGVIRDCNAELCGVLGRAREELAGTPLLKWVAAPDRPTARDRFTRTLAGESLSFPLRFTGGRTALTVDARPLKAADESVDGVIATIREVETTRRENGPTAALSFLLENLPGHIVAVLDPTLRIRYVRGLARSHWHDDAEFIGRDFAALLENTETSRTLLAALRKSLHDGNRWDGMLWFQRRDQSVFRGATFAIPWRDARNELPPQYLIAVRDATDETELRRRLTRAERLGSMGEVVVGVGRTLSESLEPVVAQMNALRASLEGTPQSEAAAQLAASIARAGQPVQRLLEFARQARLAYEPCALREISEAVVADWQERFDAAGIDVEVRGGEAIPAVIADRTALRRVLGALLENALEATRGIEGAGVVIEVADAGGAASLRVFDSGIGVASEDADRLFRPFYTTKPAHLGLGLPLARALVEGHGGRIWIEPLAGGGALTAIELPWAGPTKETKFRPTPQTLVRDRRVLLIDDDASLRLAVRRFLERVGFDVVEAWSGRSALAALTGGTRPHIVITDLKMQDGNGDWFLQQLSKDFPALMRRTVVMTGAPNSDVVDGITRATGCPVLRKPFDLPELLEILTEISNR